MNKTILLTRPRAASERWAAALAQRGFACVIEPLLTVEPTAEPRPPERFHAVLITSANALAALKNAPESIADLLPLPCFCVGAATGAAARGAGFTDIRCGASDSAALARRVVEAFGEREASGNGGVRPLPAVLHIAGEMTDGKAGEILARNGLTLVPWIVYRVTAAEDFTPETRALFARGGIAAIPVFSPRSARLLVALFQKNGLAQACSSIAVLGLSQAVADVLGSLPWRRLRVAKSPTEEDILACLQSEFP